jgi:hypothetical protein
VDARIAPPPCCNMSGRFPMQYPRRFARTRGYAARVHLRWPRMDVSNTVRSYVLLFRQQVEAARLREGRSGMCVSLARNLVVCDPGEMPPELKRTLVPLANPAGAACLARFALARESLRCRTCGKIAWAIHWRTEGLLRAGRIPRE